MSNADVAVKFGKSHDDEGRRCIFQCSSMFQLLVVELHAAAIMQKAQLTHLPPELLMRIFAVLGLDDR